jgi:hypothetical protein
MEMFLKYILPVILLLPVFLTLVVLPVVQHYQEKKEEREFLSRKGKL